jgi:serine/threonine protein kinase
MRNTPLEADEEHAIDSKANPQGAGRRPRTCPDELQPGALESPRGRLRAALADIYHIERELGAGGMSTVYLAEDLKHHRKVAVKVLRPTADLQHPHTLPLHDSGRTDGFLFYVMPYVDGESLRERLTREKQLPVPDAVRIATEVASALATPIAKA